MADNIKWALQAYVTEKIISRFCRHMLQKEIISEYCRHMMQQRI